MNVAEWTAREDIKKWALAVRHDAADFIVLDQAALDRSHREWSRTPSEDLQRLNVRVDQTIDRIWNDSAHWYKSLQRKSLPKHLRQAIRRGMDAKLRETVLCLRNLREHWIENRRYFAEDENTLAPANYKDVLWFRANCPGENPWVVTWSTDHGYRIGGVNPERLLAEIDAVDAILAANPMATGSA